MQVTGFMVTPSKFVPGDEVTLSFTVKASSSDTVTNQRSIYVDINTGSGYKRIYSDNDFAISSGQSKNVAAQIKILGDSDMTFSRGTTLNTFRITALALGAIAYATYPVTVLDSWHNPKVTNLQIDRASSSGVLNDEGNYLVTDLQVDADSITGLQMKLYAGRGTMPTTTEYYTVLTLTSSIADALVGITNSRTLISGIWSNAYDWHFLLYFGDAYENVQARFMVSSAFANVHLSGKALGGVRFGGFSTSTDTSPKFECDYPSYLTGGIEQIGDGIWTPLALASGVTTPGSYGGGILRARKIENRCMIQGSVMITPGSSTINIAALPNSDWHPDAEHGAIFSMNACQGRRIARVAVHGPADTNPGYLCLEWVWDLANNELETGNNIWVQCSIEYWAN